MRISKRSDVFIDSKLSALRTNHPYLLLFQKEDWKDYAVLLAKIYDVLEDETKRVPFDLLKSVALQHYATRLQNQSLDQKISQFFLMMIAELDVLKDSHDESGQRYLETTRSGKQLLQMIETLIEQKTQFSGTSAEVLLGSLNNLLTVGTGITLENAISHHKNKISEYKKDLERIQTMGVEFAELLPMGHSAEALFRQAEEAAVILLVAIEDVKTAIDKKREDLAQSYLKKNKSAGSTIQAVTEFYSILYETKEYLSYIKAKDMLSFLPGYAARFAHKNVDKILFDALKKDLITKEILQKSNLKNFQSQFQLADQIIGQQIKSQIYLLQQQVFYAITSDLIGAHQQLRKIISQFHENPSQVFHFCEKQPLNANLSFESDSGDVTLFDFNRNIDGPPQSFSNSVLDENEEKSLFLSLLAAEEKTVQFILEQVSKYFLSHEVLSMSEYQFKQGLIEYYVLSEIALFDSKYRTEFDCLKTIQIKYQNESYSLKNVSCFKIYQRSVI
ncbi:MAG: hypothetical protein ACK5P5_11715 [Pseudobdellovibrionaceae bacterium]